jgi:L-seryl-tRNA(Ser) seleniumtransferase
MSDRDRLRDPPSVDRLPGDELLGGPQAGLLAGTGAAVDACRHHPLAADLRAGDPAVVGRIHDSRLLLDPRTLTDDEAREVARAVRAVAP